jgi:glycosyltransferase involved in cell wall biosynthesis
LWAAEMKILIIGHACSPQQGSEPSVTWNWAWHLSRYHHVWVVAHPHDRSVVERFVEDHTNRNLRFYWLGVPRFLDPWGSNAKGGDRGLWLHYLVWLRLAYRKAIELHEQIGFDIVHHVSYGSVSAPPPAQKLGVPFVWGPIGGGQCAPAPFRHYFGRAWKREIVRNVRIRLLEVSPSLISAARASFVTLATNQETANLLRRIGARDVRLYLDSGISSAFVSNARTTKSDAETLTLLWAGRMQPRKALPLALQAIAEAHDVRVRLLIAGDGEMRKVWEDCAKRLHVESNVEFLGSVPWKQMLDLYQRADAFLFTSLRDSFGTQVLEAMGQGLPILTLDHQGVGTFVPPGAGIKTPVTTPGETIRGIADGIRWLARNPDARWRLGDAGRTYAETQTWERRAEWMSKLYEEALSAQVATVSTVARPRDHHGV